MRFVALLLAVCHSGSTFFSEHFTKWLDTHHNIGARQLLERADLKDAGSFGGRLSENETIHHYPVVFVHGVSNTAGNMMKEAAHYYQSKGYSFAEMYATTYDNPSGDKLRWIKYTMKCEHVKRFRLLIEAVHDYTGLPVNVVAFSMGVPISRKAILGGRCVENNEDLGPRITEKISTYIGIAGPNKGVAPVVMGVPMPLCAINPTIPVCNPTDGLFSGACPFKSRFIDDINKDKRYEGKRIFTIGSTIDEVVGHNICFEVTTRIDGQDGEKIFRDKKHDDTFKWSYDVQLAMLQGQPF